MVISNLSNKVFEVLKEKRKSLNKNILHSKAVLQKWRREKDCPKQTKAERSYHHTREAKGVLQAETRLLISNMKTYEKEQHSAKCQYTVKSRIL